MEAGTVNKLRTKKEGRIRCLPFVHILFTVPDTVNIFFHFSPNPGEKIVLSIAKMMIMDTPPVTTVVTMLRMPSGRLKAAVTGFQMQVNRFMMKKTPSAPAKWNIACLTTGPLLRKVMFL